MSVHIHTNGDSVEPAPSSSGEHRPPPIPADAKDGRTSRERLEASANALRSRLARTLESLDRRRHDALNIKVQAARHPLPIALLGAGAVVVVGGTALTVYHARKPPKSELGELVHRVRAAVRGWKHPKRVAHPEERSLTNEVVRGVVVSVASYAISQLAQRALVKFFPSLHKEAPPK